MEFDLRSHTILLTISGSRAFGLHHAESDIDLKGVAIPPQRFFTGCVSEFEQADDPDDMKVFVGDLSEEERRLVGQDDPASTKGLEGSIYGLRKFCRLAAEANPNLLEVLFCRDQEVRLATAQGQKLRANRNLFVSVRAKHTFSGYAASQLKRIQTHRRWLLNPPTQAPTRADYGLPERTLIPNDQLAAAWAEVRRKVDSWEIDFGPLSEASKIELQERMADVLAEQGVTAEDKWKHAARGIGYDENFIALLDRERRYEAARREWQQYGDWKRNRNSKRAALEAHHGYDTKHAAHLFRLLKMCRELLETGEFWVWRGDRDAEEIRSVLSGAWPYEKLIEWVEAENKALTDLVEQKRFVVPRVPDLAAIDDLCCELVTGFLHQGAIG